MSKNASKVGKLTLSKDSPSTTQPTQTATTTTIEQEEKTMKKNTSATTSTSDMTAKEFKQMSYDAYLAYVAFIEGKKSSAETVEALSPLMSAYGFALSVDNLANLLTVKMTAYGKDKGEQAKKVKSISTFRAFVKGGWKDVQNAPVHSNAGKNPAEVKSTSKTKKPTKAELEAQNAESEKRIAALVAELAEMKKSAPAQNAAA